MRFLAGELERKVADLERTVDHLAQRLAAVEAIVPTAPQAPAAPEAEAALPPPRAPAPAWARPDSDAWVDRGSAGALPLIGRSFLVIGGAFLVRALTDRDLVPRGVGVALGLAFASIWVLFAWRAAAAGQRRNADFHAATALLVGFPLIVETGTRLGIMSPPVAGAVLLGFTFLLLATADRHRLQLVAWASTLASVGAATLLFGATEKTVAPLVALVGLALASAVLADRRGWTGLRWPVALMLDLLLVRRVNETMAMPDLARGAALGPWLVGLAWAMVALYLLAQVHRVFVRARTAGPLEVVQPVLVVVVLFASRRAGPLLDSAWPAAGAVVLGLGLLALFGTHWLSRRNARTRDAAVFGALGCAFVIAGGALLTSSGLLALFWGALGLGLLLLGRRRDTELWWTAGFALTLAATTQGGLLAALRDGLLLTSEAAPPQPGLWTWGVLALAVASAVTTAARRDFSIGVRTFLSLGHLLLGGLGLAAAVALLAIALAPSLGAHPAAFVLVRTLTLVGGTLAFALAQRRVRNHDLCWAAFVFLGLAFVKLLAQDLPQGHMLSLVVAFSAFGGAIIALPKLLRRPPALD